jgi:hypothetical protein
MYFPPSQIETDLYTDGSEYMLSTTNEPYIGNYWKIKRNGTLYTGNNPNSPNPIRIIKLKELEEDPTPLFNPNPFIQQLQQSKVISPSINSMPENIAKNLKIRVLPLPFTPTITEQSIKQKFINRYFAKRNDNYQYLEISNDDFLNLSNKSNTIAWDLYDTVSLVWVISGDRNNIALANAQRVKNIMEPNSPKNRAGKSWIGFDTLFNNNYLQFFQSNKSKTQSNRTTPTSTPPQQSSTSGGSGGGGY